MIYSKNDGVSFPLKPLPWWSQWFCTQQSTHGEPQFYRDLDALQFLYESEVRAKIFETVAKFTPITKRACSNRVGRIFFVRLLYQTVLNMHHHSGIFENSCIFKITQCGLASRLVKEGGCRVTFSSVSFSKRCLGRCKSDENQKIPGLSEGICEKGEKNFITCSHKSPQIEKKR